MGHGSGPQLPAPQFPCMWHTGKGYGTRCPPPTSCVVLRICLASLSLVLICKGSAVGLAQAGTWAHGGPQLTSPPPETPTPLKPVHLGGPGTFPSVISQFRTPIHQMPMGAHAGPSPQAGREVSDVGDEVTEVPGVRARAVPGLSVIPRLEARGDAPPPWAVRVPHSQQHPSCEDPSWPDAPTGGFH